MMINWTDTVGSSIRKVRMSNREQLNIVIDSCPTGTNIQHMMSDLIGTLLINF